MRPQRSTVSALLRRATELQTAMEIASKLWSPDGYIHFLHHVKAAAKAPLHPDTIKTLQGPISKIPGVLEKQVALDLLSDLGKVDRDTVLQLLLRSGQYERAISSLKFASKDMSSHKAEALLEAGALSDLAGLIVDGWDAPEFVWQPLLEKMVQEKRYSTAKQLWLALADRGAISKQSLSSKLLLEFITLSGQHHDQQLLAVLVQALTPRHRTGVEVAKASLEAFASDNLDPTELLSLAETLGPYIVPTSNTDIQAVADALASSIVEVLNQMEPLTSSVVGNAVLLGAYQKYSSQTVFHVHRYLVGSKSFRGDLQTAQILANAAYRLGNSKMVAFRIWQEYVVNQGIEPNRKLCETMLMCQLVGSGYRSSLYFLWEMRHRRIFLRQHVQRLLVRRFESVQDQIFVHILSNIEQLDVYRQFDLELAEQESRPRTQAKRNADLYLHGRKSEDESQTSLDTLQEMIQFDLARDSGAQQSQ